VIYFDTSVLTAYYTVEEQTVRASEIVASTTDPVISDLVIAELNLVLTRKAQQGLLSAEALAAVFSLFDEHAQSVFLGTPISSVHVQATRELAARCPVPLRTLDALHLVLATSHSQQISFATFDQRLAKAARAVGMEVLD
jgi:predicted nucleic acid-binding protein